MLPPLTPGSSPLGGEGNSIGRTVGGLLVAGLILGVVPARADEPALTYPYKLGEVWTVAVERTIEARTSVALPNDQSRAMESRLATATSWRWTFGPVAEDGSAAVTVTLADARLESSAGTTTYVVATAPEGTSAEAPAAVREELAALTEARWRGTLAADGAWRALERTPAADGPPETLPSSATAESLAGVDVPTLPLLPSPTPAVGAVATGERTANVAGVPWTLGRSLTRVAAEPPAPPSPPPGRGRRPTGPGRGRPTASTWPRRSRPPKGRRTPGRRRSARRGR